MSNESGLQHGALVVSKDGELFQAYHPAERAAKRILWFAFGDETAYLWEELPHPVHHASATIAGWGGWSVAPKGGA